MKTILPFALLSVSLVACAGDPPEREAPPVTDETHREQAVSGMHDMLLADVVAMRKAVVELQEAAPVPLDRGWDPSLDREAIAAMKDAWIRARTAYERVEGALAPMFPDIDFAIDARYDDFLTQIGGQGDQDLFDAEGVTGMHAIERILWAAAAPARVVTFERALPGYTPAAFPKDAEEAKSFKDLLCQKLITDAKTLETQWAPSNIDAGIAFQGLVLLVAEQREKVKKAASNEEESRYAQRTMADLRDNLEGSKAVYAAFRPWIVSKAEGRAIDADIQAGFAALDTAYRAVTGDSIPEPPATWSAERPSSRDLETPFGRLVTAVESAVDPGRAGSMAGAMRRAADLLGFEQFEVSP